MWLSAQTVGARTNQTDGNTELAIYFNLSTTNINAYDTVKGKNPVYGEWTTKADSVVEVTENGKVVGGNKVTDSDLRGRPVVTIDLGKAVTEKTTYHVKLKGFKGCGSKMIIEQDIKVDPKKVTLTQVEYRNPEQKGDIALTLSTDVPFNVKAPEYDQASNTYIKVRDENGNDLPVQSVVVATDKSEGDWIIINLKGGADSKKFTIEWNNAFAANFADPTEVYYFAENTIVVDQPSALVNESLQ